MMMAQMPASGADGVPTYCSALSRVAALINTRERFASIIGQPREGNFLETNAFAARLGRLFILRNANLYLRLPAFRDRRRRRARLCYDA